MADDTVMQELERLRAENAALKARSAKGLSLKVSEKGAVSVYGLGRFPVTLYKEQWTKLLDMAEDIRAFIRENETQLKAKEEKTKGQDESQNAE
jgi:hypothetical protein